MSKDKPKAKINFSDIVDKLTVILGRLKRYRLVAFLAFIIILYGFVLLRISSLSGAQPTNDAVSSQVKAAKLPHIDQSVINQLQSLQDNSVNVKTLFSQARSNPFQ